MTTQMNWEEMAETMEEWMTMEEAREYWQIEQAREEWEIDVEWLDNEPLLRTEVEQLAEEPCEHDVWSSINDNAYWDTVHQEMMIGGGHGEYEPNGYTSGPIIPSGIPLATIIWGQLWEDILIRCPTTINELASEERIDTIGNDFIFNGPPVIGVRI